MSFFICAFLIILYVVLGFAVSVATVVASPLGLVVISAYLAGLLAILNKFDLI
ncbi:hypothetical protein [Rhizobium ruizarguesonis]|uniref:hypothetical protein n=1 Tax=Rhizobium ruizarguesonis TaxID=2081791 RepID=UPI0013EE6220|nr:hypothetical protein [Rhizobium ruizarguesonis]